MSRKNQIDQTIVALEQKRSAILDKANAECAALKQAILMLKAQRVKRTMKPRAVVKDEKSA